MKKIYKECKARFLKWLCTTMLAGAENLVHVIIEAAGANKNLINDEGINWRSVRQGKYVVNSIDCSDLIDKFFLMCFMCR